MKIAIFFPKSKSDILTEILSSNYPDKLSGISSFNKFGMEYELFDPLPFPLNPVVSHHSLYSGIDPIRSFSFAFKRKEFDIILCVGESSALCFVWMQKFLKIKLPPIIVWDPALTLEWRNRVKVLQYVLPNVASVAVLGKNQQAFIDRHIGECNTTVLPHWIDCRYFSPKHCSTQKTTPYIFAVGDDISRDYALLENATKDINIQVIIVSRKFKPKSSSNIKVISKFLSFSELRQLYHNALFIVVPLKNTHHAGGINAIHEAMAMQKASIVSNSEGVAEYISDKTSIIIEPKNISALKEAILLLLHDKKKCNLLATAARTHAENFYACDILAKKFRKLFDKMLVLAKD